MTKCECCHQEMPTRKWSVGNRGGGNPKRFCSKRCGDRFRDRGPDVARTCEQCGAEVESRHAAAKFCSTKCRALAGHHRNYTADRGRVRNLAHRFKLTPGQVADMLAAQGDRCAICSSQEPGGRGDWHIDHDHGCCAGKETCGRCVRGLLCTRCNVGMGYFADDPDRLLAAAAYLISTRNVLEEVGN